jgi:hypothetical protein
MRSRPRLFKVGLAAFLFQGPDIVSGALRLTDTWFGFDSRFEVTDGRHCQRHRVRISAGPSRLLITHSWSVVTPNLDLAPAVSKLSSERLLRIELSTKGPRRAGDAFADREWVIALRALVVNKATRFKVLGAHSNADIALAADSILQESSAGE